MKNTILKVIMSVLTISLISSCGSDFNSLGDKTSNSKLKANASNPDSGYKPSIPDDGREQEGDIFLPDGGAFNYSNMDMSGLDSLTSKTTTSSNTTHPSPDAFQASASSGNGKIPLTAEEEAALDNAIPTFPPFIEHLGKCVAIAARDGAIAQSWQTSIIYWRDNLLKWEEWALYLRDNRSYTTAQWGKIASFYYSSYYSRFVCNTLLNYPVRN